MGLDEITAYFESYDHDSFAVYTCQGQEPSEADVAAVEAAVGMRLPDEFRTFTMSALGGLYMEAHEHLWPRAEAGDVGPFWTFLHGIAVFGISADIPDWLDLRVQAAELRDEPGHLAPFLSVMGDPRRYCFDAEGAVVLWDPYDEPEPTGRSFAETLMAEVRHLEDRLRQRLAMP